MRKALAALALAYILLALYYRAREAAGLIPATATRTAGVESVGSASSDGCSRVTTTTPGSRRGRSGSSTNPCEAAVLRRLPELADDV